MNKGYAIHLLNPVQNGKPYLTMRCGLNRHQTKDTYNATINPTQVNCTKCLNYINNPWRVLRKYGKVKVSENNFVMIWGDYGYKVDMVVVPFSGKLWQVRISYNGSPHIDRYIEVSNMADLGFEILKIYETDLIFNL